MSSTTPLGSYVPGTTWLHRLPAGTKLLGLVLASVVVVVLRGPVSGLAALGVALTLVAWSGMGLRLTLRTLRGFLVVAAALAAYHLWQGDWRRAVEQVSDLLALILLATVMTATTPVDEVLDVITRALGPFRRFGVNPTRVALAAYHLWQGDWRRAVEQVSDLLALILLATALTATTPVAEVLDVITRALWPFRRFGVNPARVALAFSLVLRSVPLLMTIASETRDAARARGLERSPRAWLTPLVIRSVAQARDTGDALHARGLGDD